MGRRFVYNNHKPAAAVVAGAVYGYIFGGGDAAFGNVATADRITFSTQTNSASATANLSSARSSMSSCSDKTTYGYITKNTTEGDRVTFSTNTTAAHANSKLSTTMASNFGLSDGSSYGYWCGGWTGSARSTKVMRITFSTGVLADNASSLSQARSDIQPLSDGVTYGYVLGGQTTANVATADRVTFSTSTFAANTGSNLPAARIGGGTFSNGSVAGYQAGGSANNTTCYKINYSTSAASSLGTILSTARASSQQGANTSSLGGYIYGGYVAPSVMSSTDYMTYSTETFGLVASAYPSAARYATAGMSDFLV